MYVYSFYKFQNIARLLSIKKDLLNSLKNLKVMGTILLSPEGINVNMSQSEKNLDKAVKIICNMLNIDGFHINKSVSDFIAFKKLKVKIKDEIIRFNSLYRHEHYNGLQSISPKKWDYLMSKEIQLIDMRNNFEHCLGTFRNAINLNLINFTDLKSREDRLNELDKKKKTAIFCTGGIRCEKAGQYLNDIGFEDVYQLQGGIVHYLNETTNDFWMGKCFVFDDRILLKNNL